MFGMNFDIIYFEGNKELNWVGNKTYIFNTEITSLNMHDINVEMCLVPAFTTV